MPWRNEGLLVLVFLFGSCVAQSNSNSNKNKEYGKILSNVLATDDPKYRPFGFWFRGREDEERKRAFVDDVSTGLVGRRIRSSNKVRENPKINKGNKFGEQLAYLKQLTNHYNYIRQQQHLNVPSSEWKIRQQAHMLHPHQDLTTKNSHTWINNNQEGDKRKSNHDGVDYELVENGFPYQDNPEKQALAGGARSGYQHSPINNEILDNERTVFSVPELYISLVNTGQLLPYDLIRRYYTEHLKAGHPF